MRITLIVWIVVRAASRKNRRRIHHAQWVGHEATADRDIETKRWARGAESERSMSLTGYDDRWNPIPARRSRVRDLIVNSSGLDNRWCSCADRHVQLVPADRVTISG